MIHPPIFVSEDRPGGANASHNMLYIKLYARAKEAAAVLFQEVVEWQFLAMFRLALLAIGWGAGFFLPFPSMIEQGLYSFVIFLIAIALPRLVPPLAREMELRGKTCEAVAAAIFYKVNLMERMTSEAKSLTYYSEFKGWTLAEIENAMWDKLVYATNKAKQNSAWILRWKEKLKS